MALYHIDIYVPKYVLDAIPKRGTMRLTSSEHALEQAAKKGFTLPNIIDFSTAEAFEIQTEERYHTRNLTKVVFRTPYDKVYDLCLAINTFKGIIITAWLNERTDNHATLYADKYDRR